ncbi:MAG: cyclophilin-like fold protein [Dehalococcoidia bacterium]|jgi:uncharacterized protein
MGKKIQIKAGTVGGVVEAAAELNETRTAQAIWEILPVEGRANLWGDEIYFSIPLSLELDAGQELVNVGDLGYWPDGTAVCIFFGRTPVSLGDEIRPASPVVVFGKVIGDATAFTKVAAGAKITIWRKSNG